MISWPYRKYGFSEEPFITGFLTNILGDMEWPSSQLNGGQSDESYTGQ